MAAAAASPSGLGCCVILRPCFACFQEFTFDAVDSFTDNGDALRGSNSGGTESFMNPAGEVTTVGDRVLGAGHLFSFSLR